MTQLLCDGVLLDMSEKQTLQFTNTNPLFTFDNLACERTTEFSLPCTPTNDRVLALARIPAYDGVGMRRKFTAQLQSGTVAKDGYLYVSSYTGKEYKAIFVTGELLGLQRIKGLGKIAEYMTYQETVKMGENEQQPAIKRAAGVRWANCYTAHPTGRPTRPSVNLPMIYEDIIRAQGIAAQGLPEAAAHTWLISEAKGINEPARFKNDVTDGGQPVAIIDPDPENPLNEILEDTTVFDYEDTIYEVQIISSGGNNRKYKVRQFRAKTDVTIECPESWPDTLYVYDLSLAHDDPDNYTHFYGGRYFESDSYMDEDTHIIPMGEPLKSRSFSVAAGECFSFVDSRIFKNFSISVLGQRFFDYGFRLDLSGDGEFSHDLTLKVKSTESTLRYGDTCRLQDNLPDVTFTDLLKVFAVVSGKVLNYQENGYINYVKSTSILETFFGTFTVGTGTFESTRTQNTNPTSNDLRFFKLLNGVRVGSFFARKTTTGTGSVSVTKDSTWNQLQVFFNGNAKDSYVTIDCSGITNGTPLVLWYNLTVLDRTNTGNAAKVENMCLTVGNSAVTWEMWKANQKGISYDDLDFGTWPIFDLSNKIIKSGEVLRTFADYAQKNVLEYKSADDVMDKITEAYTIQNDNLATEKTLATIPFSEGAADLSYPSWVFVADETTGQILGTDIGAPACISRLNLQKSAGIQMLCDASTQVKVNAYLTLAEYMSITPKTRLLYDNTLYVWTASTWKEGTTEFTLAKL